jgi:hypothetical protein
MTTDTTWVAGYKCTSSGLYVATCFLAVFLQIGRNFVWTKTSQATREALHEPVEGKGLFGACFSCSGKRMAYIRKLLMFTLISMLMYIVNILLILGANLGILGSVLIGNLLGTWLSVSLQKQDKARTAISLKTMLNEYNQLENIKQNGRPAQNSTRRISRNNTKLTNEEKEHLETLKETRKLLKDFILN